MIWHNVIQFSKGTSLLFGTSNYENDLLCVVEIAACLLWDHSSWNLVASFILGLGTYVYYQAAGNYGNVVVTTFSNVDKDCKDAKHNKKENTWSL